MDHFKQTKFLRTNEFKFERTGLRCIYIIHKFDITELFIPYEEIDYEKVTKITSYSRQRILISFVLLAAVIVGLMVKPSWFVPSVVFTLLALTAVSFVLASA